LNHSGEWRFHRSGQQEPEVGACANKHFFRFLLSNVARRHKERNDESKGEIKDPGSAWAKDDPEAGVSRGTICGRRNETCG